MAITYSVLATGNGTSNFVSPNWGLTVPVTVPAGASRIIGMYIAHDGSIAGTVWFAGVQGEVTFSKGNQNNRTCIIGTIRNPAAGSMDVRVRFGSTFSSRPISYCIVAIFGDGLSLRGTTSIDRQLVTSADLTLTGTSVGDVVFGMTVQEAQPSITATAPATELFSYETVNDNNMGSYVYADAVAGNTTLNWTSPAAARWSLVGIALRPALSGASVKPWIRKNYGS